MGKFKTITLSEDEVRDIHKYVITHSEYTAELLE